MPTPSQDSAFTGSIPQLYERYMVPMLFAPYAADMAERASGYQPSCVLEIAAGTGCVTRALSQRLPASAEIVATDLNPAMLEHAAAVGASRPVQWRQADAMALPFADAEFDLVVCQFGAMFFPDRRTAFAEAARRDQRDPDLLPQRPASQRIGARMAGSSPPVMASSSP